VVDRGRPGASRWAGILGVVVQIFLAGGIIAVLGHGPFGFGSSSSPPPNFWHNAKCFLLFCVALGVAESVWLGGGFYARRKLFESSPPDAASHRISWWILVAGAFLIYAVLSILYDFARAARRFSRRSARGAAGGSRARRRPARGWPRSGCGSSGFSPAACSGSGFCSRRGSCRRYRRLRSS
jgi:hypothetical protein